jgi:pyruvate dehydrogenase E1 component alpha subunit
MQARPQPAAASSARADPLASLLDTEGRLTAKAEADLGLSPEKLRDLYRWMVTVRRLDQEALNLQRQGELGLWGQLLGQEAAQVGAAMALEKSDWIFPSYREFGMAVCRGIDPGEILGIFRGLVHGAWDPKATHFAPFTIPVATQVPHAVGFAMGCRFDGERTAVLVAFGDGATSAGDWHEGMNFAGVFKAPVVFLCQNNQWAISVPLRKQTAGPIAARAQGYGFPGVRVDGNDILTVYGVVRAAAERARAGEGPCLIEALTYRMGAHSSSDDPSRYRTASDLEPWSARDPITRFQQQLRQRDALSEQQEGAIRDEAEQKAGRMRQRVTTMPVPDAAATIFDHVYSAPPAGFQKEREAFAASLEGPTG